MDKPAHGFLKDMPSLNESPMKPDEGEPFDIDKDARLSYQQRIITHEKVSGLAERTFDFEQEEQRTETMQKDMTQAHDETAPSQDVTATGRFLTKESTAADL